MTDEKQWAVVFQSPDHAWLEQAGSANPVQQEWRAMIVGTWDECQRFSDSFYNNFQHRGCSMGFYYIVRASVAAALAGKPHNEVTFGGYVSDDEPAPDAPPDNLHIAAAYSGDHYEHYSIAEKRADGSYHEAPFDWPDSFATALAWTANPPAGVEYFIVPFSAADEIDCAWRGDEYAECHTTDNRFEHWQWVDGQIVVATHELPLTA